MPYKKISEKLYLLLWKEHLKGKDPKRKNPLMIGHNQKEWERAVGLSERVSRKVGGAHAGMRGGGNQRGLSSLAV